MESNMELILGHNQFIGISHISEEKSREKERQFSKVENIYRIVEYANQLGYKNMIIETHPKMLEFINYYEKNQTFIMDFYLQMPYAQGYVQRINEKGIHGFVYDMLKQSGPLKTGQIALKSAYGILMKDYSSLVNSLISMEISPFTKVNIKAVLLHNVMTDLLLSLECKDAVSDFISNIEKFGLNYGFSTLNFPLLSNRFNEWNISSPLIMTPVNPKGFDMNPTIGIVSEAIKDYRGDLIAMNILGGGAFSLKQSKEFLNSFENIKYCVIGASTFDHLSENKKVFG
jgi:hypothetical protein